MEIENSLRTVYSELKQNLKESGCSSLFEKCLFQSTVDFEDEIAHYKIESLDVALNSLKSEQGVEIFELVRKSLIFCCAIENLEKISSNYYAESVRAQFVRSFERFIKFAAREKGWGADIDDVFWKDLAIARTQIFPAGAQIVENFSGLSLKQGLSKKPVNSVKYMTFLIAEGKNNYYQIHTHTSELRLFNEKGWEECYLRIASMLELHPDVRGMFGGSWFYDPALKTISPNLYYLQKTPLNNGAKLFYIGQDNTGNALGKSKTRNKLFEDGKYIPQSYLLIWPREALIKWSKSYVSRQ